MNNWMHEEKQCKRKLMMSYIHIHIGAYLYSHTHRSNCCEDW